MSDKILCAYIEECEKYGFKPDPDELRFYKLLVESEGGFKCIVK